MGCNALAASELEYYGYRTSYKLAHQQDYRNLEPLSWYLEDYNLLQGSREEFYTAAVRRHLKASGIEVENSKGEWGLGQHEVNITYGQPVVTAWARLPPLRGASALCPPRPSCRRAWSDRARARRRL